MYVGCIICSFAKFRIGVTCREFPDNDRFDMSFATLLLCRPFSQSKDFHAAVERRVGASVATIISPALEIQPIEFTPPNEPVEYFLFTSVHAVTCAKSMGLRSRKGALCVGDSTARVAADLGFEAESASGNLDDLLALVRMKAPKGRLLHVSGEVVAGDLVGQLKNAGLDAKRLVVYRQLLLKPSDEFSVFLMGSSPKVLPLFSPRSASIVKDMSIGENTHVIAMSDAVRDVLDENEQFKVDVVESPNFEAMLSETCAKLAL